MRFKNAHSMHANLLAPENVRESCGEFWKNMAFQDDWWSPTTSNGKMSPIRRANTPLSGFGLTKIKDASEAAWQTFTAQKLLMSRKVSYIKWS
jgi:hypothetical protein